MFRDFLHASWRCGLDAASQSLRKPADVVAVCHGHQQRLHAIPNSASTIILPQHINSQKMCQRWQPHHPPKTPVIELKNPFQNKQLFMSQVLVGCRRLVPRPWTFSFAPLIVAGESNLHPKAPALLPRHSDGTLEVNHIVV